MKKSVRIKNFETGDNCPLLVMSGPCIIESRDHCLKAAEALKKIFANRPINFVFKSSFDKANRSAINSFRGPGLDAGLKILEEVQREFDLPVVTDVHTPEQATIAAEIVDIIQIPAFLCRQTDLLIAAGETQKPINIKKGQFMAPWDMGNVVDKITSTGNEKIILVERGVSFGYNTLISDMCAIPIMKKFGYPVCFDASHSVQQPGGLGTMSGGKRAMIPTLSRAAIASGANALFIESHPDPENAKSDAATVYPFARLPKLLDELQALYELASSFEDYA